MQLQWALVSSRAEGMTLDLTLSPSKQAAELTAGHVQEAAPAAATGAPRAEGMDLDLTDATWAWLSDTALLCTLADGALILLTLHTEGGTVKRMKARPQLDAAQVHGTLQPCSCNVAHHSAVQQRTSSAWHALGGRTPDAVRLCRALATCWAGLSRRLMLGHAPAWAHDCCPAHGRAQASHIRAMQAAHRAYAVRDQVEHVGSAPPPAGMCRLGADLVFLASCGGDSLLVQTSADKTQVLLLTRIWGSGRSLLGRLLTWRAGRARQCGCQICSGLSASRVWAGRCWQDAAAHAWPACNWWGQLRGCSCRFCSSLPVALAALTL